MQLVNLEYLRIHAGRTLEEVADTLNVSKSTILNWEKSPENLSIDKLGSYAHAIGFRLEDLFDNKEERQMEVNINDNGKLNEAREKLQQYIENFEQHQHENELLNLSVVKEFIKELQGIRQYIKSLLLH